MASLQTEPPPSHPTGRTRRRAGLFIAAFVALQFIGPLSYLVREDTSDDRFTWRSLTASAAPSCETRARTIRRDGTARDRPLHALLHEDWVRYVQEGRRAVIDAVLIRECASEQVERVELITQCRGELDSERFSLRCQDEHARRDARAAAR
jgi:hypothetical protein